MDDFAIQYVGKQHVDQLVKILCEKYEALAVDWDASLYCGITCKWDYAQRTCDISMPGYLEASLAKLEHPPPTRPQHAPHRYKARNTESRYMRPNPPTPLHARLTENASNGSSAPFST